MRRIRCVVWIVEALTRKGWMPTRSNYLTRNTARESARLFLEQCHIGGAAHYRVVKYTPASKETN